VRVNRFFSVRENGNQAAYKNAEMYTEFLTSPIFVALGYKARSTRPLESYQQGIFEFMRASFLRQRSSDEHETGKAPFLVVKRILDAILDETFKPGDRLPEAELGKIFEVSRSPVREALFALEKEGTVIMEPYKGAIVKPLSPEEALDIAELRLALITMAAKLAHHHLSPADFDVAQELSKQLTRSNSAQAYFKYNRQFWGIIFEKTQRPVLWEVFRQLDDRSTRYYPLLLKAFPNPATRPRFREVLVELYQKGRVEEALRTFKKIYSGATQQVIDFMRAQDLALAQPKIPGEQIAQSSKGSRTRS
jgi:DNA-binding GntR family transcriptional regulator